MLVVVRLAERLGRREQVDAILEDARRHELDVRRDAHLLDREIARSQVLRDGQLERALVTRFLVLEVVEDLHRAFAEALPPDDDRAVQVLQRARHDLRRAGALRADQHRHRILALASVVARQLGLAQLPVHADGRDDGAFLDECVAHLDGLLEKSARVAAYIEDQPAQGAAVLLLHRADRRLHVARRGPGEAGEPDVADAVVEQLGNHGLVGDRRANQVELARLLPLVLHDDRDARARLSAHPVHCLLQLHGDGGVGVDLRDHIALLDACAPRRRVLQHLSHRQAVVDHRDDEAEPAELAARLDLHLLVEVRLQQPAVRIQRREHAVDGGVFDLALVALRDEVVADEREHLAHLQGDLPDGIDVAVIEVARRVPDGDAHLALGEIRVRVTAVRGRTRCRGARLAPRTLIRAVRTAHFDHHFGDLPLHRFERRGEHLLRADTARIDVVVFDLDNRTAEDVQARQVVVAVLRVDCRHRVGRPDRSRRAVARDAGERQKHCNRKGGEAERGLRSHWDYVLAGEEASDAKDIQRMDTLQGMLKVEHVIL